MDDFEQENLFFPEIRWILLIHQNVEHALFWAERGNFEVRVCGAWRCWVVRRVDGRDPVFWLVHIPDAVGVKSFEEVV